jgi:sialate O-acetylesterase
MPEEMRLFLISLLFLPLAVTSQVTVAKIFSDNMVLQRDQPIHIWGKGIPGKPITVSLARITKISLVETDSTWNVYFKKQKTNAIPQSIQIKSDSESIELRNILIGDVWVCSGQSNMEWPMFKEMHFKEEVKRVHQPLIRLYNPSPAGRNIYGVPYSDSLNKRLTKDNFYEKTNWLVCDSNSVKSMSAVGYYFAREIVRNEKVPIGLINLSIGGAPIETFISRETLQRDNRFSKKVQGDWLTNESLPVWIRERGRQNVGANPDGYGDDLGLNHAYKPGFAYASGIAPIIRMPIKGVLWYQGESNSQEIERVNEYRDLLHLLINDYREKWKHTNKRVVGERLARWALNKTYEQNIVPSGPLPLLARYVNGKVIVTFKYTAKGLSTSDGKPLKGFSTDGKTEIEVNFGDTGITISTNIKPDYVYYGWKPFSDGNLVNSEGLPASTFKIKVQ